MEALGVRARRMCSDSEEDSPSACFSQRGEENFTCVNLMPNSSEGGQGGQCLTQRVLMAAILTI